MRMRPGHKFLFCLLVALLAGKSWAGAETCRESQSLNGWWDFYPDGKAQKYTIRVPSFWDAPQDYGYPAEWAYLRHGVYHKQVQIPASMVGKEIFIRVARVSVLAKMSVNGHPVGAEDSGGYMMLQLPYLIDITPFVKFDGENEIVISVWGGKSMQFENDRQEDLIKADDFPPDTKSEGRLLYPWCVDHWDGRRGVNGDVSLVAYPKVYVSNTFVITDLQQNTNQLDDQITLHFTLQNKDTKTHKLTVHNSARLVGGDSKKDFETSVVVLPPDSSIDMNIPNVSWTNASYWWPHDPELYELNTELLEDGKTVDSCQTRFGFRQFYVRNDHYELNGVRVNLRGDSYEFSWHKDYVHGPSTAPVFSTKELMPDFQKRLVREYQKMNNNVLRVHKASGLDELYDTCDEIGMMVFDEAPFWQTWIRTDERAKTNFEAWVRRWIVERRNHPSIIAWDAANECWHGPIGMYSVQAARSMDPTRPVFQDDPWGPGKHDDPGEPYPGDEECHHYTGGYPFQALDTKSLYDVYHARPDKPVGEGEAIYADGWPLMDANGQLNGKRSRPGEFGNPDMLSQAQWLRAACRMVRGMRYAGLADSRLYADWMYAFDPIEANIKPSWTNIAAPGIQPVILQRPILNLFTTNYPEVRYNDASDYYRNTFSPVAVFDKEADQEDRIGAIPKTFKSKETLARTLIVYNDALNGGNEISVYWSARADNPISESDRSLARGAFAIQVPYGEKREKEIRFQLPSKLEAGEWLDLKVTASKNGQTQFCETNRLGALLKTPPARLVVDPASLQLGTVNPENLSQWHVVRLKNLGGGQSEAWKLSGNEPFLHFKLTAGNLRGEQEVYFQISSNTPPPGNYQQTIRFVGAGGTSGELKVQFKITP